MAQYKTFQNMASSDEKNFSENGNHDSSVHVIQSLEDRKNLIQTKSIVVIDNYTDWCGPCKNIAPKYVELARKYQSKNCVFAKEDVDKKFGETPIPIRGVPSFHFYMNGNFQEALTVVGADIRKVENNIQMILS